MVWRSDDLTWGATPLEANLQVRTTGEVILAVLAGELNLAVIKALWWTHAFSLITYTISFKYNIARMSTDSFKGKSPGCRMSTYYLMGKYLGYSMYVLFAFSCNIPATQLGVGLEAIFSQKYGRSIRLVCSNK